MRWHNNAFSLLNVFFGAVLPHTIYNSQDYSSNYNSTVCTKKALFLLDFPHFFVVAMFYHCLLKKDKKSVCSCSKSANRNAGADWNIQRHKIIRTNTSTHNEEVNFWHTLLEWETILHVVTTMHFPLLWERWVYTSC